MTETDARAVLLMRCFERTAALAADDAAWAGREARRLLGEAAAPEAWLARRARLALGRLAEREPGLRSALAAALAPPGAKALWLLLALAAGFGLLGDGLGRSPQINLLALPLLGLLAWNGAVYGLLLAQRLRQAWARRQPGPPPNPGPPGALALGLARLRNAAASRWHGAAALAAPAQAALAGFADDWWALSRPLHAARSTALLHAAAALLALGALLAIYLRGLVADYQAGWDSTFLQPAQVHALLSVLLGPASALAGLPLPGADTIAGLRLSAGGGESAAPWLHRWALTLALVVVLPRALLAGLALRRARQLAAGLSLPDDADLQRLLQAEQAGTAGVRAVAVLPYSYRLDAARQAALAPALAAWLGPGLQCEVQPGLPLGAEDRLPHWLPATLARLPGSALASSPAHAATAGQRTGPSPLLVLLFALTATPERESHGALVQALVQALGAVPGPRPQLRVAVDESGYRQRLAGPDGEQRLAQRRAAWEALLMGLGVVPGFIDLSPPASPA